MACLGKAWYFRSHRSLQDGLAQLLMESGNQVKLATVSHPPLASGMVWSMAHPGQEAVGCNVDGHGKTAANLRSSDLLRLILPSLSRSGSPQYRGSLGASGAPGTGKAANAGKDKRTSRYFTSNSP